ncbi:putative DNA primase/helicase [Nitrosomonas marina]|uniref:Putative DNA primase/helicase n=1 Tax=Nitrosomonas marina TaxID=917 RepID=A0A1I0D6K1_9PROT|nr:phage/plasmid primase, P4 family [Nitrosomonas marina]SET27891.1 putative DNA primase/helicase [Nitrosomonas marina]
MTNLINESFRHKTFADKSIEKGQAFLMQNILNISEKNNTSSTSNTGNGFNDAITTSNLHKSSTCPEIEADCLIEYIETKNGFHSKLVIESKAAEILRESLHGHLAHDIKSQTWHSFTGSHWQALESTQLADKLLVSLIYTGAGDLGFKTAYKNGIKSLLVDGDMLPLPEIDNQKLPFINGLLDLSTKQLVSITAENAQTWCLPYEYIPGASCPKIKEWLLNAVDHDRATVNYLRAWLAAVLHGRADLQKFLHLLGSGGTGKGVFIRLLYALVGKQNAVNTNLDQLEQNRFETANLYNKRLAIISETDKYGGSINNLKAITGQDYVRLERKHQQQAGGFVFQGLVVMASNESLQVTDHTSGLDRRRITVIFNRRATDDEKLAWERQGGEEAVLHSELPGLVNWLIELTHEDVSRIIRNPPERIVKANLNAMTASNPVADWITECCVADIETWTQIGDKREIKVAGQEVEFENANKWLYANFLQWCSRAHKAPLSIRRFKELLIQTCTTLNIDVNESRRGNGNGIHGIRIRSDQESKIGNKTEPIRI